MGMSVYLGLIKFQVKIFWKMSYLDVINAILQK